MNGASTTKGERIASGHVGEAERISPKGGGKSHPWKPQVGEITEIQIFSLKSEKFWLHWALQPRNPAQESRAP